MANQNGENMGTKETRETNEQTTAMTTTKGVSFGTGVKVACGLAAAAAFTGLGWILRGVFGGGNDESEMERTEAEHPEE